IVMKKTGPPGATRREAIANTAQMQSDGHKTGVLLTSSKGPITGSDKCVASINSLRLEVGTRDLYPLCHSVAAVDRRRSGINPTPETPCRNPCESLNSGSSN